MSESRWALLVLAAAVFGGVWYLAQKSDAADGAEPAPTAQAPVAAATATPAAALPTTDTPTPPEARAASPEDISKWIADVSGGDAARRAAAISALASAPREQAVPVLRRVLNGGEPSVDRPLALRSLRELALQQGDADGKVRDAIREAIYHSDDQNPTLMADAQDALDVVEESEMR